MFRSTSTEIFCVRHLSSKSTYANPVQFAGSAGGSPSTVLVQASKVGKNSDTPSYEVAANHQHPNPFASIEAQLEQLDLSGMSCAEVPGHHSTKVSSLSNSEVRDWNYLMLANGGKINILYLTRGNREILLKEQAPLPG
jgi:hypothetical protein